MKRQGFLVLSPEERERRTRRNALHQASLKIRERIEHTATCKRGHELRRGPWGLRICESCSRIAMREIRERRAAECKPC